MGTDKGRGGLGGLLEEWVWVGERGLGALCTGVIDTVDTMGSIWDVSSLAPAVELSSKQSTGSHTGGRGGGGSHTGGRGGGGLLGGRGGLRISKDEVGGVPCREGGGDCARDPCDEPTS